MEALSYLIPILLYVGGPLIYVRTRKVPVTAESFRRFCVVYFLATYIAFSGLKYVLAEATNFPGIFFFIITYIVFKRVLIDKNLLADTSQSKHTTKASPTQGSPYDSDNASTQSSPYGSDYNPTHDPVYDSLEEDFDPFDQNNFQRPADDFYAVSFDEDEDGYTHYDCYDQSQTGNRYSSLELEEEFGLFGKKEKDGKKRGIAWVVVIVFALGIVMYAKPQFWTVFQSDIYEENTEVVTEIEELGGIPFGSHSVEWYVKALNQEALSLGLDEDDLLTDYEEDRIDNFTMYDFTFSSDGSVTLFYDASDESYSIAIFEYNFDGTLSKPTKIYCKALFSLLESTQDSVADDFLTSLNGSISSESEYAGSEAWYYIDPTDELFYFSAYLF